MRSYTLSIRLDEPLLQEARTYYEYLLRQDNSLPPNTAVGEIRRIALLYDVMWSAAYTINISGNMGVVIPLTTKRSELTDVKGAATGHSNDTELLIWRDYTQVFHVEQVSIISCNGGSDAGIRSFRGYIAETGWPGNVLRKMRFDGSKDILMYSGAATPLPENVMPEETVIENDDKPPAATAAFMVAGGDRIITSITEYCKCFDNVPGTDHQYRIQLCVAQPNPGSRDAWAFSSAEGTSGRGRPVYVGHTFLILTEITPVRTTIRNIGFYPKNGVTPLSPESESTLNNDEQHDYDVALTVTMTSSAFFSVLNFIFAAAGKGAHYNLNSNNCTTFALDALAAGSVTLPRSIGRWTNGQGLNPGDLGEDILGLKLSSDMTRTTQYGMHANAGSCY